MAETYDYGEEQRLMDPEGYRGHYQGKQANETASEVVTSQDIATSCINCKTMFAGETCPVCHQPR